MDSVDMRLLKMLSANARVPLSEMGREVGLSISGVRKRIKHLEKSGLIKGYTAVIDPQKFGRGVLAFVNIEVDARSTREIAKTLSRCHEVCELHQTTGDHSLLVKVRTKNLEDLKKFVDDKINAFDSVKSVMTTVTMDTLKEVPLNV